MLRIWCYSIKARGRKAHPLCFCEALVVSMWQNFPRVEGGCCVPVTECWSQQGHLCFVCWDVTSHTSRWGVIPEHGEHSVCVRAQDTLLEHALEDLGEGMQEGKDLPWPWTTGYGLNSWVILVTECFLYASCGTDAVIVSRGSPLTSCILVSESPWTHQSCLGDTWQGAKHFSQSSSVVCFCCQLQAAKETQRLQTVGFCLLP